MTAFEVGGEQPSAAADTPSQPLSECRVSAAQFARQRFGLFSSGNWSLPGGR